MRKTIPVVIVLVALVALSGCSSMLKSMGGVSKEEFASMNQQVASLSSKIDVATKVAENKASVSQVDELKASLANLQASLAQLEGIKADLATLKSDLALLKTTTEELLKTKALVDQLYTQVGKLTDDTLLKLASLIQQALVVQPVVVQTESTSK